MRAIAEHARDSDVVLFSGLAMYAGAAVAVELHKPRIGLWLIPVTTTGEFSSPMTAPLRLPRWANRLTFRALHATLSRYYGRPANAARERIFGAGHRDRFKLFDCPVLYGLSSHLVARPSDWPENHQICGHWSSQSA